MVKTHNAGVAPHLNPISPGTPPELSGVFEFGKPDYHYESLRAVAADPRWESECVEEYEDGVLLGALQVSWPRKPGVPKGLLGARARTALGRDADRVVVVGCATRYLGGGLVRARTDPWATADVLETLVRRASGLAQEQGADLVALSVPHEQVPSFQRGFGQATCEPVHLWADLDLGDARDVDSYVAALPRDARYNWKQDAKKARSAGLALAREDWDADLVKAAAHQVADVSRRNGVDDDPVMVAWRLEQWREQTLGDHLCLTARDNGSLVGACFTRVGASAIDAFEVGLDPDHPHRHTAYSALVFASTVSLATDHGLTRVELGVGHPFPKAKRGATLTRLWDMTAR